MAKNQTNIFQVIKSWSITILLVVMLVVQNILPRPGQEGYNAEAQGGMIWYVVMALTYFYLSFALLEQMVNQRYQRKFGSDWVFDCEVYTSKTHKLDFYHQVKDMDLLAISHFDLERIIESDLYKACLEQVIVENSIRRLEKRLEPMNVTSSNSKLAELAKRNFDKTELTEELIRTEILKTRKELAELQAKRKPELTEAEIKALKEKEEKLQKEIARLQENLQHPKPELTEEQIQAMDEAIRNKKTQIKATEEQIQENREHPKQSETKLQKHLEKLQNQLERLQENQEHPKQMKMTKKQIQATVAKLQRELETLQVQRQELVTDYDMDKEPEKARSFIYLAELSQEDEFEKKDIPKDLVDPFTGEKVTGKFGFILIIVMLPWLSAFQFQQGQIRVKGYDINVKKTKCTFVRADYLTENIPVYKCTYCAAMNEGQVDQILEAQAIVDYEKLALAKVICEQKGDNTQGIRLLQAFAGEADYLRRQGDTVLRMFQEDIRPTTPTAALVFKQFSDIRKAQEMKRGTGWIVFAFVMVIIFAVIGGKFLW